MAETTDCYETVDIQLNAEKCKLNEQNNGKSVTEKPKKAPIVRKRSFIKTPSFAEYLEQFQNGEFDPTQKPEIIFCGQQTLSRQLLSKYIHGVKDLTI